MGRKACVISGVHKSGDEEPRPMLIGVFRIFVEGWNVSWSCTGWFAFNKYKKRSLLIYINIIIIIRIWK